MCKLCDIDGRKDFRHGKDYVQAVKQDGGNMEDELAVYFENLAQSFMPTEKQRRRNVGSNKARDIATRFVAEFQQEAETATQDLVAGNTDTDGWFLAVESALTDLYLNGAAAAAGYIGKIEGSMLDDVESKVVEQEQYLERFKGDLDKLDPSEYDAGKIMKRVMLYAPSSVEVVEKSLNRALKRPELPFYPKQGSYCRHNCGCQWKWKTLNKSKGSFEVTWVLDPNLENCEICLARAAFCAPLIIEGGIIVYPNNIDEMMA